ncbi:MAG: hypothetical protein IT320_26565 [Anaerolineae bacterium]|nr:hypothetical protein [Anaerolineae bacterium]
MSTASDSDLARLLDFTPEDLQANHDGRLSPRQTTRLKRLRRRTTLINAAIMFLIGLAAAVVLFLSQRDASAVGLLVGLALTVINAVVMARAVQNWLRLADDLRGGDVETLNGVVERTVRVIGRVLIYVLKVDRGELVVPKDVFNAVPDGARYCFYRARRSGTLLAAEPA